MWRFMSYPASHNLVVYIANNIDTDQTSPLVITLTLKAPITTAADVKFATSFPIFDKNEV